MTQGVCKNCQHWGDRLKVSLPPKYKRTDSYLGLCAKSIDISPMTSKEVLEVPDNVAVSSDCEDYGSRLYTGPVFGCIHFEEKK